MSNSIMISSSSITFAKHAQRMKWSGLVRSCQHPYPYAVNYSLNIFSTQITINYPSNFPHTWSWYKRTLYSEAHIQKYIKKFIQFHTLKKKKKEKERNWIWSKILKGRNVTSFIEEPSGITVEDFEAVFGSNCKAAEGKKASFGLRYLKLMNDH